MTWPRQPRTTASPCDSYRWLGGRGHIELPTYYECSRPLKRTVGPAHRQLTPMRSPRWSCGAGYWLLRAHVQRVTQTIAHEIDGHDRGYQEQAGEDRHPPR